VIITIARAAVSRGTDEISASSATTLIGTTGGSGSKAAHYAKKGTILNARFPDKNRVDRSGDRTVQADRSKIDDAAGRSHIYGVARKSAPDEQGYKVKERGVQVKVKGPRWKRR
jgi:hypothetical protein